MTRPACLISCVSALVITTLPVFTGLRAQAVNAFEGSRVVHAGVIVRDVDQAVKTYADVFGMRVAEPRELVGKIDFAMVKDFSGDRNAGPKYSHVPLADNLTIELVQPLGGASPWRDYLERYGEGLHHICFAVKDVRAAIAQLQAIGGRLELGGSPRVMYAYVNLRNQVGFTVELVQMPASAPAPATEPPQADSAIVGRHMSHIGIAVPDVEKAASVFSTIVGTPAPAAREYPGIEFPKGFTGDPQAHPKIITFPMNVRIEFAEPKGGASPWRDFVGKYGPAMHHLGMPAIGSMERTVTSLEKMGGRVLLRAPGGVTTFVDLKPQPLGLAFEVERPR